MKNWRVLLTWLTVVAVSVTIAATSNYVVLRAMMN